MIDESDLYGQGKAKRIHLIQRCTCTVTRDFDIRQTGSSTYEDFAVFLLLPEFDNGDGFIVLCVEICPNFPAALPAWRLL